MNNHPFLINEDFIAYLPSLGKALGSIEDAVICQWLWFRRDRETDETTATAGEIADAIGMSESTLRKRLARLKAREILTTRRLSAFNSTSVWSVHLDRIPTDVSAGQSRGDQIGHPGETDPVTSEVTNLGTSGMTKSATPSPKNRKNRSKNRGDALVVVEPAVRATPPTTTKTPDEHLEAAGVAVRDRGRFREYMRKVKGSRNADAVILTTAKTGELTKDVREWRASLDIATEPDAEPILCEHGQDVALGVYMCRECDPARRRPAASSDVEPDGDGGTPMPSWLREALDSGDRSALVALVAADETTHGGVTPSILESVGSGAQNGA